MKRIKIAFSLKEYQKGIYEVETVGDDLPEKVRIVCTDRNVKTGKTKNMPIVALVGDDELMNVYDVNGNDGGLEENHLVLVKYIFEDGDMLCYESDINKFIYICTGRADRYFHALLDNHKILFTNDCFNYDTKYTIRLATKEESKQLFLAINKAGKYWDSENKCIKSKQTCSFKPFEKVIGKYNGTWQIDLFNHFDNVNFPNSAYRCMCHNYNQCIKYTDDTEYLVGTREKAPLEHTELI